MESYTSSIRKMRNDNRLEILSKIGNSRKSYPFFVEKHKLRNTFIDTSSTTKVSHMLESDNFETFYKVFTAKDYGKTIPERNNINKEELSKTEWFRGKISDLLANLQTS